MRVPFMARWWWHRVRERVELAVANALPRWLVARATLRLGAEVTTGAYADTDVPSLPLVTALQRWDRQGLAQHDHSAT